MTFNLQLKSAPSNAEKIAEIEEHFAAIMETLGLDLSNPSLKDTPRRVAKMYVEEVFSGLDPSTFPAISFFESESSGIVFIKSSFTSFCEHHFVPMQGHCYVAYLPNKKLIGLSKIPRIVRYFAKRPQLQERLTTQVSECLISLLETEDVAVSVTAVHACVIARGVCDSDGVTTTQLLKGQFETDPYRSQFLANLNK